MSAASLIDAQYGEGCDLYKDIFNLSKDCSAGEIKKAYHKVSWLLLLTLAMLHLI
jgi:hypothetical protein